MTPMYPQCNLRYVGKCTGSMDPHLRSIRMAPMATDDWWEDYLRDGDIRAHYFQPGTDVLFDPSQYHHGRLWKGDKIVVPTRRIRHVIHLCHDLMPSGHWGITRTCALIKRTYIIPRLKSHVRAYVSQCDLCKRYKADHQMLKGFLHYLELPEQKWQSLSMDWTHLPEITNNGIMYNEVLTVTDRATRMVHLLPTRDSSNALETAEQFIQEVVRLHGLPSSIVSDRDSVFTSSFWRALCFRLDIKRRLSTPFHPSTNGQAERTNQTMKQVLRILAASRLTTDWKALLALVEIQINHAPIGTTELSPFYLNYGFHPVFQLDVLAVSKPHPEESSLEVLPRFLARMRETWEQISVLFQQARQQAVVQTNRRRRDYEFYVGQEVLISQQRHRRLLRRKYTALSPRAIGPYRIKHKVNRNAYVLDIPIDVLGKASPVFHISDLIPYAPATAEVEGGLLPPSHRKLMTGKLRLLKQHSIRTLVYWMRPYPHPLHSWGIQSTSM